MGRSRRERAARRTKAGAQTAHARTRAYERYGLRLDDADLKAIIADIQQGRAHFVCAQSLRVSVFDVKAGLEQVTTRVVYDRQRKTIVTFLGMDMVAS